MLFAVAKKAVLLNKPGVGLPMSEIKRIKADDIFPFISELLENGQGTRISVVGESMYPFLRDGLDSVKLTRGCCRLLSRGDIVMIRRADGDYVMHRIIEKKQDCFYIVGDAQRRIEGPIYPRQLVAVVTDVWRKDRHISCSSRWWRLSAGFWLYLRPYRRHILKVGRLLQRFAGTFYKKQK